MSQSPGEFKPSRRDLLRPVEYLGGAAIAAVFTGGITLLATRDLVISLIATGGVFIVVLMVLALLAMAVKPDVPGPDDPDEVPPSPSTPPSTH